MKHTKFIGAQEDIYVHVRSTLLPLLFLHCSGTLNSENSISPCQPTPTLEINGP